MDAAETVITGVVPLVGVAIGAWLTDLQHKRSWRREQDAHLKTVQRETYAKFIAAARTWQSNVLEPDVRIETSHRGMAYADAGAAYGDTVRGLAEVRLVAGSEETISAAVCWQQALRDLSAARATSGASPAYDTNVRQAKQAEDRFLEAARRELIQPA